MGLWHFLCTPRRPKKRYTEQKLRMSWNLMDGGKIPIPWITYPISQQLTMNKTHPTTKISSWACAVFFQYAFQVPVRSASQINKKTLVYPLVIKRGVLENGSFRNVICRIKPPFSSGVFQPAMFNYQKVTWKVKDVILVGFIWMMESGTGIVTALWQNVFIFFRFGVN